MSTHNICFRREIRKILCGYPLLSGAMYNMVQRWIPKMYRLYCLFVLRFYGPVNPMGLCRARLPNHTFTGEAYSSKGLTSIVHILLPETDNCPS